LVKAAAFPGPAWAVDGLIIDFNDCVDGQAFDADVCIIGSGAAGLTLANELDGHAWSILMLEGGGHEHEADSHSLFDAVVLGPPHRGIHAGRARVFGGTTTLWPGQALRLDAHDFESRAWVPHSGWPISELDLEPFYARAEQQQLLGPDLTYERLCSLAGVTPAAFDSTRVTVSCSRWISQPNFATQYGSALARSQQLTVLLHANATEILLHEGGASVDAVTFASLSGRRGVARARAFVLCAGGIENPRLLLASGQGRPAGIGNAYDLVGRYFHDHLYAEFGSLRVINRRRLNDLFQLFYRDGTKYGPKVIPAVDHTMAAGTLKAQAEVVFVGDPDSPAAAASQLVNAVLRRPKPDRATVPHPWRPLLRSPVETARLAYRVYVKHRVGTPANGAVALGGQCEMPPRPESRVTIGRDRDRIGVPRAELHWRLGDLERATLADLHNVVASELSRLGLAARPVDLPATAWPEQVADGYHHMGTTRMSDSERSGVVDRNCRVHGVSNLFVGGSSVFPTGGRSNPTLTIVAMCVRLADHLKASALRHV
jgi:choline dehydrogenase-like flavoprotein